MSNIINFNVNDYKEKIYLGSKDGAYIEILTSDMNAPVRMNDGLRKIEKYFGEIKEQYHITNPNDAMSFSTGNPEKDIELILEVDEFVKNTINEIFDGDVSSTIFGQASSLTMDKDGNCFYEIFLNAILPFYEKTYQKKIKKLSVNAQKYVKKK